MAELADAPDLGSGVHDVQVQVLLSALRKRGCEKVECTFSQPLFQRLHAASSVSHLKLLRTLSGIIFKSTAEVGKIDIANTFADHLDAAASEQQLLCLFHSTVCDVLADCSAGDLAEGISECKLIDCKLVGQALNGYVSVIILVDEAQYGINTGTAILISGVFKLVNCAVAHIQQKKKLCEHSLLIEIIPVRRRIFGV